MENDLISRSALKENLQAHHDFFVNAYGGFSNLPQKEKARVDEITHCIVEVCHAPAVDPESLRPKGKWRLNKDGSGTCSECRRTRNDVWDMDNWDNFCSHCGADMREGK